MRPALYLFPLFLFGCDPPVQSEADLAEMPDLAFPDLYEPPACTATSPRPAPATLLVEPDDDVQPVLDLIDSAKSTLEITIYEFTNQTIVKSVKDAATRGVAVRVILDGKQYTPAVKSSLESAGVQTKLSSPSFFYTHQKSIIADSLSTLVFSGNFDGYSFNSERDYGVIQKDRQDAEDLRAVFEADWAGTAPDLSCTRLIVTPENADQRILALIASATKTLDIEALYITSGEVKAGVLSAHNRGVKVRCLLTDPSFMFSDASTGTGFKMAGIDSRRSGPNFFIHAKLLIVDGTTAFIGSQNFSNGGLSSNREAGLILHKSELDFPRLQATFEADFAPSPSF